ncbi:MAG: hypothetical protein SNJ78_05190 [Spirochaetales bacterium]
MIKELEQESPQANNGTDILGLFTLQEKKQREEIRIQKEILSRNGFSLPFLQMYFNNSLARTLEELFLKDNLQKLGWQDPTSVQANLKDLPDWEVLPSYLKEILNRLIVLNLYISGNLSVLQEKPEFREVCQSLGLPLNSSNPAEGYPTESPLVTLRAFKTILQQALSVLTIPGSLPIVSLEESRVKKAHILLSEQSIQEMGKAKQRLEEDIRLFEQDRESFQRDVLQKREEDLHKSSQNLEKARIEYNKALEEFSRGSAEYEKLQLGRKAALEKYETSRQQLGIAEAIHQYASTGYSLPGFSPLELLERQVNIVNQLEKVVNRLQELRELSKKDFFDRMDPAYRDAKIKEEQWQEIEQYLELSREKIQKELTFHQNELALALSTVERQVLEFCTIKRRNPSGNWENLPFSINPKDLLNRGLSDIRVSEAEEFVSLVEKYFTGTAEDVSKKLSADILQWVSELALRGNVEGLLRDFGLAYYYDTRIHSPLSFEGSPTIISSLFEDPSWKKLLEDYVDLGPALIPVYEYSGEEARVVGYEEFYPESLWTVEDYVNHKSEEYFQQIQKDEQLAKLYAFFKMLVATQVIDGVSYIGKDIGDLVFDHVDQKAECRQRTYLKWWRFWTHAEGRRIRALREDIARVHQTGVEERESFVNQFSQIASVRNTASYHQAALESLTSPSLSGDSFIALLAEKTALPVSSPLSLLVHEVFSKLGPIEKMDLLSIFPRIQIEVEKRISYYQGQVNQRSLELSEERSILYDRYTSLIEQLATGKESVNQEELDSLILSLYSSPSFTWDDHYLYDLTQTLSLVTYSRRGLELKVQRLAKKIEESFAQRLSILQEKERQQALSQLGSLQKKKEEWEAQMQVLFQTGSNQWTNQTTHLLGLRKRWQEEYKATYRERKELWNQKYELLQKNRDTWLEELTKEAITSSAEKVRKDLGIQREKLQAELEHVPIPLLSATSISMVTGNLQDFLQKNLGGLDVESLLSQAEGITKTLSRERPVLSCFLPQLRDTGGLLRTAAAFAQQLGEEVYKRAALVSALQMAKLLEEAELETKVKIQKANQKVDKDVTETLRGAGYQKKGSLFHRRIVIDETLLGGIERETQEIEGYAYFQAPSFKVSVDLRKQNLEGRTGDYLQALVQLAQGELAKYLELIFGRPDTGNWSWEGVEDLRQLFEQSEQAYRGTGRPEQGVDGLFNWHLGYAPVMDSQNPEAVKEEGYGELGRIFTQFFRNQARKLRGLASFDIPWYSRKLWDDDKDNNGKSDSWFASPTPRSLTNLTVSIAATAFANPWMAAALNLVDDAAFTALDIHSGSVGWRGGVLSLVKQAGVSALSTGVGLAGQSIDNALDFGKGVQGAWLETATDVGIAGARNLTSFYGQQGIEAVTLGKKGFGFDRDQFLSSVSTKGAFKQLGTSLLIETVRTGVQSRLEGNLRGYVGNTLAEGHALNALASNLAANALEYACTGKTQLNLLNAQAFHSGVRGGLWELNLGSKGDSLFSFGSGGTDVSLGSLIVSAKGIDAYVQNYQIRKSTSNPDLTTALRMLYSNGQQVGQSLYKEVLQGKSQVVLESGVEYEAKTVGDPEQDGRRVYLRQLAGKNSDLQLGIVLSHESYRNGIWDGDLVQKIETEQAVKGHMQVALQVEQAYGSIVLSDRMRAEVTMLKQALSSGNWQTLQQYISHNYDSTQDYWKLLRDGRLINDGKACLMVEIRKDDGTLGWQLVEGSEKEVSTSQALVHFLGEKRALELLGGNPNNLDMYDSRTLKDVLKCSDQTVQYLQRNPLYAASFLQNLDPSLKEKLIGETLMKRAGIEWNAEAGEWLGEGTGIRITDRAFEGNANIRHVKGSEYLRFSVTGEVVRKEGAYETYKDGKAKPVTQSNTTLSFSQWNLDDGRLLQKYLAEGKWNSVDNSSGRLDLRGNPIGKDQPYQFVNGPLVQGNTLASGQLNFRWAEQDSKTFNEVLIISDAKTISGERILSNGLGENHPTEGRWLVHFTGYGSSDGCIVVVGEENMKKLIASLKSMGVTRGYVISSRLTDENTFAQGPGYKRGNW